MPDYETLAHMYGLEYEASFAAERDDSRDSVRVVEWLKKVKAGTFIDYGCGTGSLLMEAVRLNWQAIGVEFDEKVAKAVEQRTGAKVVSYSNVKLLGESCADILHLGDVIEHLTELNHQMPEILRLIKPGGLLLAQGPLEGNLTFFTLTLRLVRSLRWTHRTEMAPYHVLLATAKGQKILFRRLGLEELGFSVREVSWPAPGRLSLSDLVKPRSVVLFTLRRISQAVSTLQYGRWGNRYFYVGRWLG